MKNFLSSIIFAILVTGCNQGSQSKVATESKSVTFSGLDSVSPKSKTEIEKYLKLNNFKFLNSEKENSSWKSSKNNDLIIFDGAGAFVFKTESKSEFDTFTKEIKSNKYENTDIQDYETMKMVTYTKGEKSLLLTSISDFENGKGMFTITFMNFDIITKKSPDIK